MYRFGWFVELSHTVTSPYQQKKMLKLLFPSRSHMYQIELIQIRKSKLLQYNAQFCPQIAVFG